MSEPPDTSADEPHDECDKRQHPDHHGHTCCVCCCAPCRHEPSGRPGGVERDGTAGRPSKSVGSSDGSLNGTPLTPADLDPPGGTRWTGDRKHHNLPYLFMRANPGDTGTRPVVGPFWESPDILILPGVNPAYAPDHPPDLGGVALADAENTIYAHVWNFGRAAAHEVIVEFFWVNPSLGVAAGSMNRIGEKWVSLGARGSGSSHRVVKCPVPWSATYVNGGHECLVVRTWDLPCDLLGTPEWDASLNRHIGQRNIHVATADELAGPGLNIHVGPLFGATAEVRVDRVTPTTMPWLQLRTGRGVFPTGATATGAVLLSPPAAIGGGTPLGGGGTQHMVHADGQQVTLTTTDAAPGPGEAHVYRVSAAQGGETFGGYTVVMLGP